MKEGIDVGKLVPCLTPIPICLSVTLCVLSFFTPIIEGADCWQYPSRINLQGLLFYFSYVNSPFGGNHSRSITCLCTYENTNHEFYLANSYIYVYIICCHKLSIYVLLVVGGESQTAMLKKNLKTFVANSKCFGKKLKMFLKTRQLSIHGSNR
jgi:hypothetical protein